MNAIPQTVQNWIKPHLSAMIAQASSNRSGVCHFRDGNRLAIYVHAIAEPDLGEPEKIVHVEWVSNGGYSDDPMSFPGRILRANDGSKVNVAAIPFADALAL